MKKLITTFLATAIIATTAIAQTTIANAVFKPHTAAVDTTLNIDTDLNIQRQSGYQINAFDEIQSYCLRHGMTELEFAAKIGLTARQYLNVKAKYACFTEQTQNIINRLLKKQVQ